MKSLKYVATAITFALLFSLNACKENDVIPEKQVSELLGARVEATYPRTLQTSIGAELKEVSAGDFVQIIDLSKGAKVLLLHQGYVTTIKGRTDCNVKNPFFTRNYVKEAWDKHNAEQSNLFSLVNGSLFNDGVGIPLADQTPMTYPMKINGSIITEGYGNLSEKSDEYKKEQKMLLINNTAKRVAIENYDKKIATLSSKTTPIILVGWSKYAGHGTTSAYRTVVGIGKTDVTGSSNILYIYSGSNKRTPDEIETILKNQGATNFVTFDGGGSTQLYCKGTKYFAQTRKIPQWIGVTAPTK